MPISNLLRFETFHGCNCPTTQAQPCTGLRTGAWPRIETTTASRLPSFQALSLRCSCTSNRNPSTSPRGHTYPSSFMLCLHGCDLNSGSSTSTAASPNYCSNLKVRAGFLEAAGGKSSPFGSKGKRPSSNNFYTVMW